MPLTPHHPAAETDGHAALIVALDAGDLADAERARAEQLPATCAGCADLLADLGAIRGAMTALPVPARRRDYQLTPEDAARQRPTTWRRFRDWLASPGSSVRPLATGLATLGVVGLLVTAGLPGFGAGAAFFGPAGTSVESAPPADAQTDGAPTSVPAVVPMPGVSAAPIGADPGTLEGDDGSPAPTGERSNGVAGAEGGAGAEATNGSGGEKTAAADTGAGASLPAGILISGLLLLAGLGLFGARIVARRRPA